MIKKPQPHPRGGGRSCCNRNVLCFVYRYNLVHCWFVYSAKANGFCAYIFCYPLITTIWHRGRINIRMVAYLRYLLIDDNDNRCSAHIPDHFPQGVSVTHTHTLLSLISLSCDTAAISTRSYSYLLTYTYDVQTCAPINTNKHTGSRTHLSKSGFTLPVC